MASTPAGRSTSYPLSRGRRFGSISFDPHRRQGGGGDPGGGIGQGVWGWGRPSSGTRKICRTRKAECNFHDTLEHSNATSSCSATARGSWCAATAGYVAALKSTPNCAAELCSHVQAYRPVAADHHPNDHDHCDARRRAGAGREASAGRVTRKVHPAPARRAAYARRAGKEDAAEVAAALQCCSSSTKTELSA
jgi:hypothetical protein